MENPEIIIIALNTIVVLMAYLVVYPKVAGSNGKKIAIYDAIASVICLLFADAIAS